ncbi:MAG TPA: single-stranded DNA-binding protein [Spirochaetota bacterium]|nr:single-stranded DNA-binding protein [Spirochaetota bacterium]HPV41397.1 single-stranded DNA-binding protein [Spirochaetota bacterium]
MQNYQNVTIEGNATGDPVMKKTKTGKNVCSFSLAMNHYSKDDADPQVSYIDVETWEKLADICSNSVTKGKRVMVAGTLRQERWEGADGKKRSRIKVIGKEIRFIESFKKPGEPMERKSA